MERIKLVNHFKALPSNTIKYSERGDLRDIISPPISAYSQSWIIEKHHVDIAEKSLSIIQKSDLLLSTKPGVFATRAASANYVGFIPSRYCLVLRPLHDDPMLVDWVGAWFSSTYFRNEFLAMASTSNIGAVKVAMILNLEIPALDRERLQEFKTSSVKLSNAIKGIQKTLDVAKTLKQLEIDLLFSE